MLPVSVVIPAYRRPEMVERAIRSVLAQHPQPAELLVIDDCSGDDTGARAAALGARLITHEENQGEGGARNTGLAEAGHDWVALLDCDDEWLPGHLETLWAARDGHVVIGTAALGSGEHPEDHRVYGWTGRRPLVLRDPADIVTPENKLTPSSVLVRRREVLAAGGFRSDMPRAADLDMWVRLLERGSALAIPRVTSLYHVHGGQISRDPARMWQAHRQVLEDYAGRPWRTRAVLRRHEGVMAWDSARAVLAAGRPKLPTVLALAGRLCAPQRLIGVAQLLLARGRGRRLASRLTPGGGPSVAVLPGARVARVNPGDVDLRRLSLAGALLYLLRRPTGEALAGGRLAALPLRAIGIRPIGSERRS